MNGLWACSPRARRSRPSGANKASAAACGPAVACGAAAGDEGSGSRARCARRCRRDFRAKSRDMAFIARLGDQSYTVEIEETGKSVYRVAVDGNEFIVDGKKTGR